MMEEQPCMIDLGSLISGLVPLASLLVAWLALKLSKDTFARQRKMMVADVRPWIVTKGPCRLTFPIRAGAQVRFRQDIEVLGSRPALRVRVQSRWDLVTAEDAREHFGIHREKITRRIGEGTLFALAPGQNFYVYESSECSNLSEEQFRMVDEGTHAIRIVMIIEYAYSALEDDVFRTTAAVICDASDIGSADQTLRPTPDGLHLE